MSRVSPLVAFAMSALAAACDVSGGARPESAFAGATPRTALAPLGPFEIDAARNILAAAQGRPHDPRWDCSDGSSDLSVSRGVLEQARALGPSPALAYGALAIDLIARLQTAADPRYGPGYFWVGGGFVAFPDGRVRLGFGGSGRTGGDMRADWRNAVPLAQLPEPVSGALVEIASAFGTASCVARLRSLSVSVDELLLPANVSREAGQREIDDSLAKACGLAAQATAPWSLATAANLRVGGVFRGPGGARTLTARLRPERGRFCLTDLEIEGP